MIRIFLKKPVLVALLPLNFFSNDEITNDDLKKLKSVAPPQESGWESVKLMFSTDDFGRLSSEVHSIIQVACMSAFIGVVGGGVIYSREAYLEFIRKNQATSFTDHLEAKKKLQDAVTISFMRGAFKWSWRLALFTTMYMTASTSIAAYRGKNGILEHAVGGGMAGALYKFKMGPVGLLVGGGLGFLLGGFAGIMTNELLKLTGMTMKEVRYYNYRWVMKRDEQFNKIVKEDIDTEEMKLLEEYYAKPQKTADITMVDSDIK